MSPAVMNTIPSMTTSLSQPSKHVLGISVFRDNSNNRDHYSLVIDGDIFKFSPSYYLSVEDNLPIRTQLEVFLRHFGYDYSNNCSISLLIEGDDKFIKIDEHDRLQWFNCWHISTDKNIPTLVRVILTPKSE